MNDLADQEQYILASKHILADLPTTDQVAFLDNLIPDFGIPTDIDATDFMDLIYHGSAIELLQTMLLIDTPVGKHIYDLVLDVAEARIDPDEEFGSLDTDTQEKDQT